MSLSSTRASVEETVSIKKKKPKKNYKKNPKKPKKILVLVHWQKSGYLPILSIVLA